MHYTRRLFLALGLLACALIVLFSLGQRSQGQSSSTSARYLPRYASAPNCTRVFQLYGDTTTGKVRFCSAVGAPGTWNDLAAGSFVAPGAITSSGLTQATNKLLGRGTASTGAIEEITLGTNLSFTGTTLNATGGPTMNASDGVIPYRSSATAFSDSPLLRVDANTIGQKNSTNPQEFRLFNTDDGAGNSEFLSIAWASNVLTIKPTKSGSGSNRKLRLEATDEIEFYVGGAKRGQLWDSGNLWTFAYHIAPASGGDTWNLGQSNNQWRTLFLGTGGLNVEATITAGGTTGNQTINKTAGSVNVAAAGTAITVTNSTVTANSIVMALAATNDSTCAVKNVVAGSGTFTINMTAACNAETRVNFFVVIPD